MQRNETQSLTPLTRRKTMFRTRNTATLLAASAVLALGATSSQAAVLTFDAGFANNVDVTGNYGSNVTTTGLNGREFIISDSLGATPNITLTWPTAAQFEWHSGANWEEVEDVTVTGDGGDHTLQVNNSVSTRTITFTPDAGFAVVFGSVDYGIASDLGGTNTNVGTFTITRVSDSVVVKTATSSALLPAEAETVDLSYTGAIGESYILELLDNGAANWGAIDDLTFGQAVPEPGSLALLGLGGLLIASRRRRG